MFSRFNYRAFLSLGMFREDVSQHPSLSNTLSFSSPVRPGADYRRLVVSRGSAPNQPRRMDCSSLEAGSCSTESSPTRAARLIFFSA